MPTANEIVAAKAAKKKKDLEAEFATKPEGFWQRKLESLQRQAQALKDCNACAGRRRKIAASIEKLKAMMTGKSN